MDLRVQNSVITQLGARPEVVSLRGFVIGWDPTTESRYVSYATPTVADVTEADVAELVAAFREIGRLPRLEYVPGFAPGLEKLLLEAGFTIEARHEYLACSPESLVTPPVPEGIGLSEPVSDEDRRDGFAVQDVAFGGDGVVTGDDIARVRRNQEKGCVVFIARDATGACVGAGQASVPGAGLVEVAGVAESHRRRGIAGSLVAAITAEAFARGVEGAWLEASGPDSWRVYERAGFKPTGQRLYMALEDQV
ncbi:MAG TPA: GNAT family N-acetyltransferase [Candidatus Limnocylindrales bacterium]|nr:GNAT family N-acetyltransferase [Candidatus Limnocylindrales bacterium]